VDEIENEKRGLPHGTNSTHFLLSVEEVAFALNKLDLHNMYTIMDNISIHKAIGILKTLRDNEHTALFLPQHSPFLNPIEECWSKVKSEVHKTSLAKSEMMADRIEEAAKKVTIKD
jgi:transposase